jgi:hypothetical protein
MEKIFEESLLADCSLQYRDHDLFRVELHRYRVRLFDWIFATLRSDVVENHPSDGRSKGRKSSFTADVDLKC